MFQMMVRTLNCLKLYIKTTRVDGAEEIGKCQIALIVLLYTLHVARSSLSLYGIGYEDEAEPSHAAPLHSVQPRALRTFTADTLYRRD